MFLSVTSFNDAKKNYNAIFRYNWKNIYFWQSDRYKSHAFLCSYFFYSKVVENCCFYKRLMFLYCKKFNLGGYFYDLKIPTWSFDSAALQISGLFLKFMNLVLDWIPSSCIVLLALYRALRINNPPCCLPLGSMLASNAVSGYYARVSVCVWLKTQIRLEI